MSNPSRNQYFPNFVTPPGDTLLETLEALGMAQVELAERTGRPTKTISEIINAKTAITTETALQFEKVLGVPARFWINLERNYREWLAREEERKALEPDLPWLDKFPVKDMARQDWIELFDDPVRQLIELVSFFGVASPANWVPLYAGGNLAFRQSAAFTADPGVVSAWLRKGEVDAQRMECAPYDSVRFRAALAKIRALTVQGPDEFVPAMQRHCARAGVAVIFVHELPRLATSGVTRWLNPEKALIQLSLRYKRDDQLWFTFFHEAGHILLHGKKDIFLEGENDHDEKEEQANRFAADILIPPAEYRQFQPRTGHYSEAEVIDFAQKMGIAPGIIVGRLQHDKRLEINHLNGLKQHLVWAKDAQ
jgi:HTH-type transcriptional regulator/antitoxin HigA